MKDTTLYVKVNQVPEELNIVCVGDIRYRFSGDIIQSWDFNYNQEILRIDFRDGSFIEFYRRNIICVEFNKHIADKERE